VPVLETASVTSADGTRVCFRTLGDGPSLVIAHGAFSTSDDYVPVAVRLAASHRVVLVDRRGYRDADVGPSPASFAQDAEDLVAVMASLHDRSLLFGHSAGALAALHAARAEPGLVRALALYEPPILFGGPQRQPLLDRYRQLRDAGEDSEALVAFTSATSAMPADAVRLWIDAPTGGPRVTGLAAGVGRDLEAAVALPPEFEPWRGLAVPVTLLVNTGSRDAPVAGSVRGLGAVLPRCRTLPLAGPEHVAHRFDPAVLADAIRTAFRD
jgi:pimeloyl-ACP methyl ester carboxylesterase